MPVGRAAGRGAFHWWHSAGSHAHRALIAAALGWALDAFDVMLFSLVEKPLCAELGISKATFGLIGSGTLVAAAVGGVAFGVIADRHGRTRALMASVMIYSVFTAACGLSQSIAALAIFRVLLGIGMGGEWASGAALVAETWPAEHRGKAMGFVQSAWAIGSAAAAGVVLLLEPMIGWRGVFFIGLAPALLALWIRRRVGEGDAFAASRIAASSAPPGALTAGFMAIFAGGRARLTIALAVMNAGALFGFWALNFWMAPYLRAEVSAGGRAMSQDAMLWFQVATQLGTWLGYVAFGFIADAIGRKRTYLIYLGGAALLAPLYAEMPAGALLLCAGPIVMFCAAGQFSGFGAVTAEIFPVEIRARAQGFTYNCGRLLSAAAPWIAGSIAGTQGFPAAFRLAGLAFLAALLTWWFIPETRPAPGAGSDSGSGEPASSATTA